MDDEMRELHKGIQEVLVAVGKIEVQIAHLSTMAVKMEDTQRTVIQLEQSVKSAHKRLDDLKHVVDSVETKMEARDREREKEKKEDKKWGWALTIPSLIAIAAFVLSIFKK